MNWPLWRPSGHTHICTGTHTHTNSSLNNVCHFVCVMSYRISYCHLFDFRRIFEHLKYCFRRSTQLCLVLYRYCYHYSLAVNIFMNGRIKIWLKLGNGPKSALCPGAGVGISIFFTYWRFWVGTPHPDAQTHTLCRAPAKSRGDCFLSVQPRPEWKGGKAYRAAPVLLANSLSVTWTFFVCLFTLPEGGAVLCYERKSDADAWKTL